MKKKTTSLILALLMVFSLLPASAFAANTVQSGTCGQDVTWTLDDAGVLTITGTGEMAESPWLSYKDSIKTVVIGEGVMSVCDNAFYECTNLEEISLPKGLDTIGSSAFRGCSSLTSITIPERVAHTGSAVFTKCTSLKNVVINGTMQTLEYSMFAGCSALESVSLPKSLKSINTGAFADCTSLKNVYFGGTEMQWYTIKIQENNDALDSANVYFALDYPFTDIADSGYRYYISLGQAVGIVNGYPDGTFRPSNSVTRAQYITMLYNMFGKPEVIIPGLLFNDTGSISAPYLDAVKWGVAVGIINGYSDNTFRPDQDITRAQMAAFSYRLMMLIAGGEAPDDYKKPYGFKDEASIEAHFVDAVNVCANMGIITGFDTNNDGVGDTFYPNATANRGQAATIIVRVAASLGGSE